MKRVRVRCVTHVPRVSNVYMTLLDNSIKLSADIMEQMNVVQNEIAHVSHMRLTHPVPVMVKSGTSLGVELFGTWTDGILSGDEILIMVTQETQDGSNEDANFVCKNVQLNVFGDVISVKSSASRDD